jgi:hypothetical protein
MILFDNCVMIKVESNQLFNAFWHAPINISFCHEWKAYKKVFPTATYSETALRSTMFSANTLIHSGAPFCYACVADSTGKKQHQHFW